MSKKRDIFEAVIYRQKPRAIYYRSKFLPDRQAQEYNHHHRGKQSTTQQALRHHLVLQAPQIIILNLEFPVKDHQPRHQSNERVLLLRRLRVVLFEAFPRKWLTAREEQEEEAAASQAGENEPEANTPHGPDTDSSPTRALAETRGDEGQ